MRNIPKAEREEVEEELTEDAPATKSKNKMFLKVFAVVVVAMLLRNNKGLKV